MAATLVDEWRRGDARNAARPRRSPPAAGSVRGPPSVARRVASSVDPWPAGSVSAPSTRHACRSSAMRSERAGRHRSRPTRRPSSGCSPRTRVSRHVRPPRSPRSSRRLGRSHSMTRSDPSAGRCICRPRRDVRRLSGNEPCAGWSPSPSGRVRPRPERPPRRPRVGSSMRRWSGRRAASPRARPLRARRWSDRHWNVNLRSCRRTVPSASVTWTVAKPSPATAPCWGIVTSGQSAVPSVVVA